MADVKAKIRNKFNVDEELESPFDIKQLKRASTYVLRYKWRMLEAFGLSILSILVDLITPLYTTWIVDDMIPAKNIRGIWLYGAAFLATVVLVLIIRITD